MILWIAVFFCVLAVHMTTMAADKEPTVVDDDGAVTSPRPRSRGPPPAHRSGYRTARPAGNGTCSIHFDPVPSTHHPG